MENFIPKGPTMVRIAENKLGMYDIFSFRGMILLVGNLELLQAMLLCKRKGWVVSG